MSFTIEQIYNCTRYEFCERANTRMEDMLIRLRKECIMLELSLAFNREKYRNAGASVLPEQKELERLIYTIESKLLKKQGKIKDIELHLKADND